MRQPPKARVQRLASHVTALYHRRTMPSGFRRFGLAILAVLLLCSANLGAADDLQTFPLKDVKPGMKGEVYTIFEGDQVEKVDLEVIGILDDALGPKQDVILVKLLGDKAEKSGVAAGMSGSPVYFDGKLAGALSLRIGEFTKDPIGGVTPIQNMLDVERSSTLPAPAASAAGAGTAENSAVRVPFVRNVSAGAAGQFLVPIETPLITAGLYPEALAQFS